MIATPEITRGHRVMGSPKPRLSMIDQIRLSMFICVFLADIVQLFIESHAENALCLVFVTMALYVSIGMTMQKNVFDHVPISGLTVIYFGISSLFIPLIATTIEGREVTYNLLTPIATFGYTSLAAIVLALMHFIYRRSILIAGPDWVAQKILQPIGLFRQPTALQLWLIGFVGAAAIGAEAFLFNKNSLDTTGFIPQFVHGFTSFSVAPLLIPIMARFDRSIVIRKSYWGWAAIYFGIVGSLSLAINARAIFAAPLTTTMLCVFIMMLMERIKFKIFSVKTLLVAGLIVLIVMPSLMRVATAMRVARSERNKISSIEMIERSIGLFFDEGALEKAESVRSYGLLAAGEWDEKYIRNEFLQRFTPIKFTDNSLYYTAQYSEVERQRLQDFAQNRFYALFPEPLLRMVGINFNKWNYLNKSYGDFIYESRYSTYSAFRTGSLVATGIAINGWYFYIYFGLLGILAFLLFDCFAKSVKFVSKERTIRYLVLSPVFLINSFFFMNIFSTEAMSSSTILILRTVPQLCVLYWVLFQVTKFMKIRVPTRVAI